MGAARAAARALQGGLPGLPASHARGVLRRDHRQAVTAMQAARLLVMLAALAAGAAVAEPVAVRHTEGVLHGFLIVRTFAGDIIASGDLSQVARGDRVTSKLALA